VTDDHRPFIDTILERPDDDGPRLVYADWLEERGDPRGEFIRLQIRWHGQSPKSCDHFQRTWRCGCAACLVAEQWRADMLREQELLTTHPQWAEPAARIFWPDGELKPGTKYGYAGCAKPRRGGKIRWQFLRGFVGALELSCETFLAFADAIEGLPTIETVRFADRRPWHRSRSEYGPRVMREGYAWYLVDEWPGTLSPHEREDLPPELFRRLDGGDLHGDALYNDEPRWMFYDTEDDAWKALSDAALKHARRKREVLA